MFRPTILLLALSILSAPAWAQQNGNVRNGLDYQPTQGGVQSRERAAGVAPPPQQERAQTNQVDDIYKQLMSKEQPGAAGPAVTPLQPGTR